MAAAAEARVKETLERSLETIERDHLRPIQVSHCKSVKITLVYFLKVKKNSDIFDDFFACGLVSFDVRIKIQSFRFFYY